MKLTMPSSRTDLRIWAGLGFSTVRSAAASLDRLDVPIGQSSYGRVHIGDQSRGFGDRDRVVRDVSSYKFANQLSHARTTI